MSRVVIQVCPGDLGTAVSPLTVAVATGEQPYRQTLPEKASSGAQDHDRAPRPRQVPENVPSLSPSNGLAGGPRLCAVCHRPPLAQDRCEYTLQRAGLVAERGLCVCRV